MLDFEENTLLVKDLTKDIKILFCLMFVTIRS